jgi:flagellar FliJ protein
MTRMDTLRTLLEREVQLRDEALAALLLAQRNAAAAQSQAESLVTYRAEYQQRWSAQFAQGGAIEIVRCYHGFIERLEQAVAQAKGTASHLEAQVARVRERLQAREVRVATVQRLIERHEKALAQAEDRRDQKNLDELAQRRRPGVTAFAH